MLKFYKKYELQIKIMMFVVWTLAAISNIFFEEDSKNKNFNLFVGIVMLLLAVFYLFEVIEFIRKRKTQKPAE